MKRANRAKFDYQIFQQTIASIPIDKGPAFALLTLHL